MKTKMKTLAYWSSISIIGLVVGISLQVVKANWTPPTGPAPTGNVGAPINTGGNQTITGVNGPTFINGGLGSGGVFRAYSTAIIDGNTRVNNAFIGDVGHGPAWAGVAHNNQANAAGYGLLMSDDGNYTLINKRDTGAGHIGFRIANVDKMVLLNNGNVGIGTTSPTQKLDVAGNIKLSGNQIYMGNSNNNFYGDGANLAVRTSGDFHVQNQAGNANKNVYANDYWINAAGKWASAVGSAPVQSGLYGFCRTSGFGTCDSANVGCTASAPASCGGSNGQACVCPAGYTRTRSFNGDNPPAVGGGLCSFSCLKN